MVSPSRGFFEEAREETVPRAEGLFSTRKCPPERRIRGEETGAEGVA